MNATGQPLPRRVLGRTGIPVSLTALGAGPVSGLMTGNDRSAQRAVIEQAVARGINWIDTAAGYGQGASEGNLGSVLCQLPAAAGMHIATKVRITGDGAWDPHRQVQQSIDASLRRLGRSGVTLLQLHNAITLRRDDQPASLAVEDVLGAGGVLEALENVRADGRTQFLGLTGTGDPAALRQVIQSGRFDTLQIPFHILNPTAAVRREQLLADRDYGQLLEDCQRQNLGVFAIRVFAAGALLDQSPSQHTLATPYFPLELYERDRRRAKQLAQLLPAGSSLKELAVRYAISQPAICTAIIGLATPAQVDEVADLALRGPLDESTVQQIDSLVKQLNLAILA